MATYTQEANHLTDLTSDEMQALLGADLPNSGREMPFLNVKPAATTTPSGCSCTCPPPTTTAKPTTTAPTSGLDWRNTAGMVQAVRNQGGCG